MSSKKEIILHSKILKKDNAVVCYDYIAVMTLLGRFTKDIGIFMKYDIDWNGDGYHIPLTAIEERKNVLLERIKVSDGKLAIITDFLKKYNAARETDYILMHDFGKTIKKVKNILFCPTMKISCALLGTTIQQDTIERYNISKEEDGYHIKISNVKKKAEVLTKHIKSMEQHLDMINQIV